jgi:hypothetical protein
MPTHPVRIFLMALAGLSLLSALLFGFTRLGWMVPLPAWSFSANHGPLMIGGFLGTLIGLERAVALGWRWAYSAPLFAAVGGLILLLGLFFICVSVVLCRRQLTGFMVTMSLGAVLWFVGNLLWNADYPLYEVVPWWIGFLVLTIAGERLEINRLMRLSPWTRMVFALSISLFLLGLAVSLIAFQRGLQLSGIGLLALALWLLYYDIAWRTVRHVGLPRFTAVCLLAGYVWLGVPYHLSLYHGCFTTVSRSLLCSFRFASSILAAAGCGGPWGVDGCSKVGWPARCASDLAFPGQ